RLCALQRIAARTTSVVGRHHAGAVMAAAVIAGAQAGELPRRRARATLLAANVDLRLPAPNWPSPPPDKPDRGLADTDEACLFQPGLPSLPPLGPFRFLPGREPSPRWRPA